LQWGATALVRLLRACRKGLVFSLFGATGGIIAALLLPKQYTSSATLIAQGQSDQFLPSALQGLAATVWLSQENDFSPKFYADLLVSRPVLESAVTQRYDVWEPNSRAAENYLQIEDIGGDSTVALEAAVKKLDRHVTTRVDA